MNGQVVKHRIGRRLAERGITRWITVARKLGISHCYLSQIVSCLRRPAKHQDAIAQLCGKKRKDLFGQFAAKEAA